MLIITTMPDASEIISYDTTGIPLYINNTNLSNYSDRRVFAHWHEDIELIRIVKGCMYYRVNGKRVLLQENDCILVNGKQMHYGYSATQEDCNFTCVLFHPSLLTGNQMLYEKYISPVLANEQLEYLHFQAENPFHSQLTEAIDHIIALKTDNQPAYEINVLGCLNHLWYSLLHNFKILPAVNSETNFSELNIQKKMVTYIYHHYSEKVTLSDISASGNICRSKCCEIFKHYLQESPIDFLNHYRLEVSCQLLKKTNASITQVALTCGFQHLSYYSKLFHRSYGCTPREYRELFRISECLNK